MNISFQNNLDLNIEIEKLNEEKKFAHLTEEDLKFPAEIYEQLPSILKHTFELISGNQRKDLGLLTILTIFSNAIRNLFTIYDDNMVHCQLYTYIIANPGQGKGFANRFRAVGLKYHYYLENKFKEKFADLELSTEESKIKNAEGFFLSGDISKAALTQELTNNKGFGVFFETEADTVSAANRSEHGSFKDILKKGFHDESVSKNKNYLEEKIFLDKVSISVFLTSTFDQCLRLIPSYEDGLFSRFIYYILVSNGYRNVFVKNNFVALNDKIDGIASLLLDIGCYQENAAQIEFHLTSSQQQKHFDFFYALDKKLPQLSEYGVINRLSEITVRICMILNYLKQWEQIKRGAMASLICEDSIHTVGLTLANCLTKHLEIVDLHYSKTSKQYNTQASLNTKKTKQINKVQQCLKLSEQGFKPTKISEIVFGTDSHKGTVSKWLKKYKNVPFLFPETETAKAVETKNLLCNSMVSVYSQLNSNSPITKSSLWRIIQKDYLENLGYRFNSDIEGLAYDIRHEHDKKMKVLKCARLPHFNHRGVYEQNEITNIPRSIVVHFKANENLHIDNFNSLQLEFRKILNVAYCGKTIVGNYLLFLGIDDTTLFDNYYSAVKNVFEKYGLVVDNTVKLVPISHDEKQYQPLTCTLITSTLIA